MKYLIFICAILLPIVACAHTPYTYVDYSKATPGHYEYDLQCPKDNEDCVSTARTLCGRLDCNKPVAEMWWEMVGRADVVCTCFDNK